MKSLDLIRIILSPLSPLYGIVIKIRNYLFDRGVFKISKLEVPVISIGNLTIGGSGKTPMTIFVTKFLKENGFKPGLISRGYGRRSVGYQLVSRDGEVNRDVFRFGDEIIQSVEECRVPAAVSESRVEGGLKLMKDSDVDVIVLDDAYQHRWIHRELNILIFEQKFLTSPNKVRRTMMPTGNLREPLFESRRGDVLVINRKFSEKKEIKLEDFQINKDKKVFNAYYKAIGFVDLKTNIYYKPEEFNGQRSLLVSGIANPKSFITALESLNIFPLDHITFRDHQFYDDEEIQRMRKSFYDLNAHSIITTHKDAIRLYPFRKELDDVDVFYLKIEMIIEEREEFEKIIINTLGKKRN